MARAMSQRRAGVSADATSLELGGPANPNAPDLVEGSAGEAETRFRLSGFGDLEQFVVQHLQGEEKVWMDGGAALFAYAYAAAVPPLASCSL